MWYGVPEPSLMMLAVTPILALLIESRMPSSEVSEPIVTVLVLVGVPPVRVGAEVHGDRAAADGGLLVRYLFETSECAASVATSRRSA